MDQKQERRRGSFQRGRRGPDHRGFDRRTPPAHVQPGRDRVDVEQIMKDLRARIAQRRGVDLSNHDIEELAARRLESVLDPRTIKPALLHEMRRGAGTQTERQDEAAAVAPPYSFDDGAIYASPRALLRFIRRLLNPLLRLFFDPGPVVRALSIQSKLNVEASAREADRERQQAEWNALHYEIVRRLVAEVSRASIELEAQSGCIESLSAKVDFNERRVRGIEGVVHQSRPASRPAEVLAAPASPPSEAEPAEVVADGSPSGEGSRRRRRRRRGRRGTGGGPGETGQLVRPGESWPVPPAPPAEAGPADHDPVDEPVQPPATTEGEMLLPPEDHTPTEVAKPASPTSAWEAPALPATERVDRPDSDPTEP